MWAPASLDAYLQIYMCTYTLVSVPYLIIMCALKMFINWMGVEDRYVILRRAEGITVKAWNQGAVETATKMQLTWCSSNPNLLLFVVPPIS